MNESKADVGEAYCPHCKAQTETIRTVPWQDDICGECQNSVPTEGS